ncbi:uncharacterized protein METZ01_LOCUS78221 [marine metagenome]|uniref:Uncharacterized protein n=1 Tax=marine metagenome TaxID=408172 RepID=A0A381UDF0_9ZZZZ
MKSRFAKNYSPISYQYPLPMEFMLMPTSRIDQIKITLPSEINQTEINAL